MKVTKKNVIDAMHQVLLKCRPGDAFLFYLSNPMNAVLEDHFRYGTAIYSRGGVQVPTLSLSGKNLQALLQRLDQLITTTVRYKTNDWINNYPKR